MPLKGILERKEGEQLRARRSIVANLLTNPTRPSHPLMIIRWSRSNAVHACSSGRQNSRSRPSLTRPSYCGVGSAMQRRKKPPIDHEKRKKSRRDVDRRFVE